MPGPKSLQQRMVIFLLLPVAVLLAAMGWFSPWWATAGNLRGMKAGLPTEAAPSLPFAVVRHREGAAHIIRRSPSGSAEKRRSVVGLGARTAASPRVLASAVSLRSVPLRHREGAARIIRQSPKGSGSRHLQVAGRLNSM